jgi:hypothetical protein
MLGGALRWIKRLITDRKGPEHRHAIFPTPVGATSVARVLREAGDTGVVYPSVRHPTGTCIGASRPRAVGIPRQERHLKYRWDVERLDRYK